MDPLFSEKHFGVLPLGRRYRARLRDCDGGGAAHGAAGASTERICASKVRRIVKPLLEVLAGVPTVVYGYFALLLVTPLLQRFIPSLSGFNALGPGIVMGIMILPLVSSLSEDALHAVPNGLREGAFAWVHPHAGDASRGGSCGVFRHLGVIHSGGVSRDWRNDGRGGCRRPAAAPDGQSAGPDRDDDCVHRSGEPRRHTRRHLEYRTIFAVGMLLFVMTFVLNLASNRLRRRFREEYA